MKKENATIEKIVAFFYAEKRFSFLSVFSVSSVAVVPANAGISTEDTEKRNLFRIYLTIYFFITLATVIPISAGLCTT